MENLRIGRVFLTLSLVFTLTGFSQSIYNGVGHIPASSQVDWTNAGLYNPISTADNILYITDFTGSYDARIQAAINAANNLTGVTIIYFPAGNYVFQQTIHLSSNIIIQGAGSASTVFKFDNDKCSHGFSIVGGGPVNEKTITGNIAKTDNVITVSNTTGYQVNDWIQFLEKTNPDAWVPSQGHYAPCGQISRITNLTSTSITVKDEASKAYNANNQLFLYKITPIVNVGIENLSIERLPDGDGKGIGKTINFEYAVNCWVRGMESKNAFGRHVNISASSHIEISGCYIHHAHDYCSGESCGGVSDGFGYGITVGNTSTNCLIENNVFKKLRHAMLTANGANCNVFTYNYSREQYLEGPGILGCLGGELHGDICLHSQYSYANLFEHNWVEKIEADDVHGNNGPYNAFIRNRVQDHNGIMHTMTLINAPNTSVLGCELRLDETYTPIVTGGSTSLTTDLYGILIFNYPPHNTYETGIMISHSDLAQNWFYYKDYMHLHDFSYFYSQRPSFVNTNYTFPSIGPEFTSQNIPAKDRYGYSIKTYCPNPTTIAPPHITGFTQTPNPIVAGHSGYVYCNATGPGSLQYTWQVLTNTAGATITFNGNCATVSVPVFEASILNPDPEGPLKAVDLGCTVSNAGGSDYATYVVSLVGSGGGDPDGYDTLKSNSNLTKTEIAGSSMSNGIPTEFVLEQNYPNPFNPSTTIRFGLPEDQQVRITVYSITGEKIAILLDSKLERGYHQVQWNGRNQDGIPVASGIYMYELRVSQKEQTGGQRIVKKMLLAK